VGIACCLVLVASEQYSVSLVTVSCGCDCKLPSNTP